MCLSVQPQLVCLLSSPLCSRHTLCWSLTCHSLSFHLLLYLLRNPSLSPHHTHSAQSPFSCCPRLLSSSSGGMGSLSGLSQQTVSALLPRAATQQLPAAPLGDDDPPALVKGDIWEDAPTLAYLQTQTLPAGAAPVETASQDQTSSWSLRLEVQQAVLAHDGAGTPGDSTTGS